MRAPSSQRSRPILEVSQLTVRRGGQTLLEEVDWRVETGGHWVVLGPNGSGKTSLLRALCGYLPPTAGTVRVLGKTYGQADWALLRRRIGLVSNALGRIVRPEETALAAVLSGREAMINYWGEPAGPELARARLLLKRVGCAGLEERTWEILSQGERQRILIARALFGRPALLLLDEPCAGLDPVAREAFLAFLGRLAGRRRTPGLVLVTHHVEEILPGFNRLLLLRAGRVVFAGEREEGLTRKHLEATFGSRVRLAREGSRWRLTVRAGRKGHLRQGAGIQLD